MAKVQEEFWLLRDAMEEVLDWRPSLVGWRPSRLEAIALRVEAIASRLEAIASRFERQRIKRSLYYKAKNIEVTSCSVQLGSR